MVANRVSLDQRFRRAGDCPICEGGDSMKRGQGARCYGFEMARGNAVVCTQIASPHASGNGWVHVMDRPCNCGEDHSAGYRGDFIPVRRETPPAEPKQSHHHKEPTEIYEYWYGLDVRQRKLRYGHGEGKYFVWQHRDEQGEWWNCNGCNHKRPGLYRENWLDASLHKSDPWEPIFIVEGEGKVHAVEGGNIAVSPPDGAGSWRDEWAALFAGRHVVILPDGDKAGRDHAWKVAESLEGVAATIRWLELPDVHDVGDWMAAGHTPDELRRIAAQAPVLTPASHQPGIEAVNVQDDVCPQPGKPCGECEHLRAENERLRDELKIADETVAHLRRDFFRLDRVMAQDSAKVTPPVKIAAYADIRHMAQARARVDRGEKGPMLHYSREALARRTGVSADTAGKNHNKLVSLKLITQDRKTEPMVDERGVPVLDEKGNPLYHTTLFMAEGPLLDEVKLDEHLTAPENGWGGKRTKKACPRCGSFHIEPTEYGCHDCGAIFAASERVDVEVSDDGGCPEREADAQDAGQDTVTPLAEECDILTVHPMNSGLNHHDERAALLALAESLNWWRGIIAPGDVVGGTRVNWQTFAAQASNERIDSALQTLRIRAEAFREAVS